MLENILLLAKLPEPGMLQSLACGDTVIRVVDEELLNQVLNFGRRMRNQLDDARALNRREVELHMRRILLKVVEQALVRRA